MLLNIDEKDINKFVIIGDRVLIKPKNPSPKTKSGLYLPPGLHEKEKVHSGYIVKTGPGYPIPATNDVDEPWKNKAEETKYMPLQAKVGDLAVYMNSSGFEIEFNNEKYIIVPHSAILMTIRDKGLLE